MHESLRVFEAKPRDYKLAQFSGFHETHWIYSCGRVIMSILRGLLPMQVYVCSLRSPDEALTLSMQFLMTFSIHAKQPKKTKI